MPSCAQAAQQKAEAQLALQDGAEEGPALERVQRQLGQETQLFSWSILVHADSRKRASVNVSGSIPATRSFSFRESGLAGP